MVTAEIIFSVTEPGLHFSHLLWFFERASHFCSFVASGKKLSLRGDEKVFFCNLSKKIQKGEDR